MKPAEDYREMLREELRGVLRVHAASMGRAPCDDDIIRIVEEHRREAKQPTRDWSAAECVVGILWAGIARLVFGRLDYLEDALVVLRDHPEAARVPQCLHYLGALNRLLPMPDALSPVKEPQRAIDWLHATRLRWEEPLGRFVVDTTG
jgi:hypothetical protein